MMLEPAVFAAVLDHPSSPLDDPGVRELSPEDYLVQISGPERRRWWREPT